MVRILYIFFQKDIFRAKMLTLHEKMTMSAQIVVMIENAIVKTYPMSLVPREEHRRPN